MSGFPKIPTGGSGSSSYALMPAPSGDTTGATDTAAFKALLAGLPTVTIYQNPRTNGAPSQTYPIGTIELAAAPGIISNGNYQGTPYYFGTAGSSAGDIGNIGPCVSIVGPGHNACLIAYIGNGDCIRVFNAIAPGGGNEYNIAALAGVFDGFTIDGTKSSVGAVGMHVGDTEGIIFGDDLLISNFNAATIAAPVLTKGATNATGGTFASGTYFWEIAANVGTTGAGETTPSNEITATLVNNGSQVMSWVAVPGATSYSIYRGSSSTGEDTLVAIVTGTSYTDTGTSRGKAVVQTSNTASSMGLLIESLVSWVNYLRGKVLLFGNTQNCVMSCGRQAAGAIGDFIGVAGALQLDLTIWNDTAQNGVVLQKGFFATQCNFNFVVSTMGTGGAQGNAAALTIMGVTLNDGATALHSAITASVLNIYGGANSSSAQMTIRYGDSINNEISQCTGVMNFQGGSTNAWTTSNWSNPGSPSFVYAGVISGDATLAGGAGSSAVGLAVRGSIQYSKTSGNAFGGGTTFADFGNGDFVPFTLVSNTIVAFTGAFAGPQRKSVIITQAAAGAKTVTWPHSVTPTIATPTVLWPAGIAPTMSVGANAVDRYELVTLDGATWIGQAIQNVS